jgi:hypothetical protein
MGFTPLGTTNYSRVIFIESTATDKSKIVDKS